MKSYSLALAAALLCGVAGYTDAGLVDPTASPIVAVSENSTNQLFLLDEQGQVWEWKPGYQLIGPNHNVPSPTIPIPIIPVGRCVLCSRYSIEVE